MSASEQSAACPARFYGYVAQYQSWLVTCCDDHGLAAMMADLGAERIQIPSQGNGRHFWKLNEKGIASLRGHLHALGYQEKISAQRTTFPQKKSPETFSAAYRMPVPAQTAVHTYSVKELGMLIKGTLQNAFPQDIWVQGELFDPSSLSVTKWFFGTLAESTSTNPKSGKRDADNQLKIVMWTEVWSDIRQRILENKLPQLVAGMKIRVRGRLEYSTKYGTPQLNVQEIDPLFTEGEIYKQKLQIVEKLKAMGIAEHNKRLPMPILPLRLAVFSSKEAAGYGDFKHKLETSRFPFHVTLFHVRVQGKDVEPMVMNAFGQLQKIGWDAFDLGIILRGGGGSLDLEGFNNLRIGEYIARCPLKFLIAIGHERDKSVLDEIAECYITPTDAALKIINSLQELENQLGKAADHVKRQAQIHLQQSNHALQLAASTLSRHVIQIKTDAERSLNHQIQQIEKAVTQIRTDSVQDLNRFQADLRHHTQNRIQIEQSILRQQSMALVHHVESTKARAGTELEQQIMAIRNAVRFNLMTEKQNLELSGQRIYDYAQKQKQNAKETLNRYSETLKLLDPTDLYRRGFVTLSNAQGKMIKRTTDAAVGEPLTVRLLDGQMAVTIDSILHEYTEDKEKSHGK